MSTRWWVSWRSPGILVECERPRGGAQQAGSPGATPSASASSGYTPSGTDTNANCSHALRSQADSDRSFITTKLNGHWLAQLSSKHAGLVADGKVWDDCAILNEFLALRLRFTDVRMLWSDEWSVFSYPGWMGHRGRSHLPRPRRGERVVPPTGIRQRALLREVDQHHGRPRRVHQILEVTGGASLAAS